MFQGFHFFIWVVNLKEKKKERNGSTLFTNYCYVADATNVEVVDPRSSKKSERQKHREEREVE